MREFKNLREARRLLHPSDFRNIHREAVRIVKEYKSKEVEVIKILQKVDFHKVHRHAGYNSLFQYAVKALGLSESQAYDYITVARKSVEVPALLSALESEEITVSKARRITPVLDTANQAEWLECAKNSSKREVERAVAKVNPKALGPERTRFLNDHMLELHLVVSEEVFQLVKKAQDLISQKRGAHCDLETTLKALCDQYLKSHDPVQKTERALARAEKHKARAMKPGPGQVVDAPVQVEKSVQTTAAKNQRGQLRRYIPARTRQIVLKRQDYQCGFMHPDGSKCEERRWLDFHHITPFHRGGNDSPENLMVLCRGHHQAVHENRELEKHLRMLTPL